MILPNVNTECDQLLFRNSETLDSIDSKWTVVMTQGTDQMVVKFDAVSPLASLVPPSHGMLSDTRHHHHDYEPGHKHGWVLQVEAL